MLVCLFCGRISSTLSMIDLIVAALAKDAAARGRQELLLAVLRVSNLLCELLGRASHIRLLSWVGRELVDHDSLLREVQLDVIEVLVLVQANLDASCTPANALHIVLVQRNTYNMTCT